MNYSQRFCRWITPVSFVFLIMLTFATEPVHARTQTATPVILVIGDSISAGYGISVSKGWVNLLQERLQDSYPEVDIVNSSISGDTTDGGLQRLPAALEKFQPDLVIIELGGNDGLRAQSLKKMAANLEDMVRLTQESGAKALLLGMRIPTNYGASYTEKFFNTFQAVSDTTGAAIVPFFLEAIATSGADSRKWFQPDGVHPTADAQPLMLETAWPVVSQLLTELCSEAEDQCKL